MFALSASEVSTYQRDGFLVRRSVFSRDELKDLQLAAEHAAATVTKLTTSGRDTGTYDDDRPHMPIQSYELDGKRFRDIGYLTVQFEVGEDRTNDIRVIEPVRCLSKCVVGLLQDNMIYVHRSMNWMSALIDLLTIQDLHSP
jgi:hypothetical protein